MRHNAIDTGRLTSAKMRSLPFVGALALLLFSASLAAQPARRPASIDVHAELARLGVRAHPETIQTLEGSPLGAEALRSLETILGSSAYSKAAVETLLLNAWQAPEIDVALVSLGKLKDIPGAGGLLKTMSRSDNRGHLEEARAAVEYLPRLRSVRSELPSGTRTQEIDLELLDGTLVEVKSSRRFADLHPDTLPVPPLADPDGTRSWRQAASDSWQPRTIRKLINQVYRYADTGATNVVLRFSDRPNRYVETMLREIAQELSGRVQLHLEVASSGLPPERLALQGNSASGRSALWDSARGFFDRFRDFDGRAEREMGRRAGDGRARELALEQKLERALSELPPEFQFSPRDVEIVPYKTLRASETGPFPIAMYVPGRDRVLVSDLHLALMSEVQIAAAVLHEGVHRKDFRQVRGRMSADRWFALYEKNPGLLEWGAYQQMIEFARARGIAFDLPGVKMAEGRTLEQFMRLYNREYLPGARGWRGGAVVEQSIAEVPSIAREVSPLDLARPLRYAMTLGPPGANGQTVRSLQRNRNRNPDWMRTLQSGQPLSSSRPVVPRGRDGGAGEVARFGKNAGVFGLGYLVSEGLFTVQDSVRSGRPNVDRWKALATSSGVLQVAGGFGAFSVGAAATSRALSAVAPRLAQGIFGRSAAMAAGMAAAQWIMTGETPNPARLALTVGSFMVSSAIVRAVMMKVGGQLVKRALLGAALGPVGWAILAVDLGLTLWLGQNIEELAWSGIQKLGKWFSSRGDKKDSEEGARREDPGRMSAPRGSIVGALEQVEEAIERSSRW